MPSIFPTEGLSFGFTTNFEGSFKPVFGPGVGDIVSINGRKARITKCEPAVITHPFQKQTINAKLMITYKQKSTRQTRVYLEGKWVGVIFMAMHGGYFYKPRGSGLPGKKMDTIDEVKASIESD